MCALVKSLPLIARAQVLAGLLGCLALALPPAVCAQTFELRVVATTDVDKDGIKKQKDLFAEAKTDMELKKKLEEATAKGKAPDLEGTGAKATPVAPEAVVGALGIPQSLGDALAAAHFADLALTGGDAPAAKPAYQWYSVRL